MQIAYQETYSDPNGFILWEALMAITLVVGVYLSSVGAYQRLALKMSQQQARYAQLGKDFDVFELTQQVRTQNSKVVTNGSSNTAVKGAKYESSRVPNRLNSLRTSAKSTHKNEH